MWQVSGVDGRSQHWSWRGGGSWGAHLEGRLCPTTEGLLLATELVALAQLQQPLPSQLFQSGVHRSREGAEVGVCPGAQSKHAEPGVPGGIRAGPLILAPVPRQLATPPPPRTQQSSPRRGPPDLRVPSAPALSVLLDSFLFRRQEDTSGSEQETLLKRIL